MAAIIRSEARLRGSPRCPNHHADLAEKPGGALVVSERIESRLDVLQDGYAPGALHRIVGRVRPEGKLAQRDRGQQQRPRQFRRIKALEGSDYVGLNASMSQIMRRLSRIVEVGDKVSCMPDIATYTHGHAESVLRSHRTRTAENSAAYLLPYLRAGLSLLDIGSGPGTITVDLAERVAPGPVTAVEVTEAALAVTRAEFERRGYASAQLVTGDIHDLPFPSRSFDVVHAHQVLQHVADPVAALREMVRVCRPGGVVAARDGDYSGFTWYPELPGLDRWRELYQAAARANGGEPNAGRRLLAWAHAAGITDVSATASTWCYADPTSREAWGGMWADRIVGSAITEQLLTSGLGTQEDIDAIAAAWREWAAHPDGWISVLHGELLIRVP
jgi:SAM-dependent methyltransferase